MTRKVAKRASSSENNAEFGFPPVRSLFYGHELDTPEKKAAYRRLTTDPRSLAIVKRMTSWGINAEVIDQLLRQVACSRSEWEGEVKYGKLYRKRRAVMARTLRDFAKDFVGDPHLRTLGHYATWNPRYRDCKWKSLSEIFRETADHIAPDFELPANRKVSFETWSVKILCHEIAQARAWAPWHALPDDDARQSEKFELAVFRAPNVETATLLSVAFGLKITPETVTQARKNVRRRYVREL